MFTTLLLLAQLHVATPVEKLHPHVKFGTEVPAAPAEFKAQAAKVIDVSARQFEFEPAEVQVDQGDHVTLRLQADDVTHGFFLESYMSQGVTLVPGDPVTVQLIANTPGTFTFFCSIFCGGGHHLMGGAFIVKAATAQPPSIASFTPPSAAVTGGTPVSITGTGFVAGATVRFGDTNALFAIVNSPTNITAMTPARDAGAVLITVINPDGQIAQSATTFTFGDGQPGRSPRRRSVRR